MDFQQSQTYINLLNALKDLLGENTLLELYERRANEEILIPISFLFNTTARNSRYIANQLYYILFGQTSTLENLQEASRLENEELILYREYSEVALEEGFDEYASLFNGIANILLSHTLAYDQAIEDIQNDQLYCKPQETLWICLGCGNILSGLCAPDICPVCGVPGGYYQQYSTY